MSLSTLTKFKILYILEYEETMGIDGDDWKGYQAYCDPRPPCGAESRGSHGELDSQQPIDGHGRQVEARKCCTCQHDKQVRPV